MSKDERTWDTVASTTEQLRNNNKSKRHIWIQRRRRNVSGEVWGGSQRGQDVVGGGTWWSGVVGLAGRDHDLSCAVCTRCCCSSSSCMCTYYCSYLYQHLLLLLMSPLPAINTTAAYTSRCCRLLQSLLLLLSPLYMTFVATAVRTDNVYSLDTYSILRPFLQHEQVDYLKKFFAWNAFFKKRVGTSD